LSFYFVIVFRAEGAVLLLQLVKVHPSFCVEVYSVLTYVFLLLQLLLPAKQAAYVDKFGEEMPTP